MLILLALRKCAIAGTKEQRKLSIIYVVLTTSCSNNFWRLTGMLKNIHYMLVATGAVTMLMLGCAKSVEVLAEFPEPAIEPVPLVAGIRYPTELTDFTYKEDPELSPEWTIKLGEANLRMFRALFKGMFIKVIELNNKTGNETDDEATEIAVDVIIEPRLEEIEFSVPEQSGDDQFTVWLRYTIHITSTEGKLITDWRVTGYGQEDEGTMGMGDETAMRGAIITALRDAAAYIAITFSSVPEVKSTLLTPINPFMEAADLIE